MEFSNTHNDNPLLGSWHLARWEITYGDGRKPTLPFGVQATGLICYTHDGMMSACIARGARSHLPSDSTLTLAASDTLPGTAVARHHRLVWNRQAPGFAAAS